MLNSYFPDMDEWTDRKSLKTSKLAKKQIEPQFSNRIPTRGQYYKR